MKIIIFDLETTGLNVEYDRIIEFCFIQCNSKLEEINRWKERVNPGIKISPDAIQIHGISNEMVKKYPRFSKYAKRIQKLINDTILIAHNAEFDTQILHNELKRVRQKGLPLNQKIIDTYEIEKSVYSMDLESTYKRYTGKPLQFAHSAEGDAFAVIEILRNQLRKHNNIFPNGIFSLISEKDIKWADRGHKFYIDASNEIRFSFGKYKDDLAVEHKDYLEWMINTDFPADTKHVINRLLKTHK